MFLFTDLASQTNYDYSKRDQAFFLNTWAKLDVTEESTGKFHLVLILISSFASLFMSVSSVIVIMLLNLTVRLKY